MRHLSLCFALALGVFACKGSEPEQQTDNVEEQSGRSKLDPAGEENPSFAFLSNVTHAGNYEAADGAELRVFELYEDGRIEVAIATYGADVDYVWNLGEAIGVGVESIDSVVQSSPGQLAVWVAEEGGSSVYRLDLDGLTLSMSRELFADYVQPDTQDQPVSVQTYSLQPDDDERYTALPRFRDSTIVDFAYPTVGSATIFELATGDNAEVFIGINMGAGGLIYATGAIVKDVGAAFELEPGYFDMQIDPVCAFDDNSCTRAFDAIGIGFELTSDGRRLTTDTIELDLKQGVG